jgi:DNA-directed RNA polymerase sigma subunit (sigma70/sigma32)
MYKVKMRDLDMFTMWTYFGKKPTLADLAIEYGVSKTRVHQIMVRMRRLSILAMRNCPKIEIVLRRNLDDDAL